MARSLATKLLVAIVDSERQLTSAEVNVGGLIIRIGFRGSFIL